MYYVKRSLWRRRRISRAIAQVVAGAACSGCIGLHSSARAQSSTSWLVPAGGDWITPSNWSSGTPQSSIDAVFNLNRGSVGGYSVELGSGATASAGNLSVQRDQVTLDLSGGSLNVGNALMVGLAGVGAGTVAIESPIELGTLTVAADLRVGRFAGGESKLEIGNNVIANAATLTVGSGGAGIAHLVSSQVHVNDVFIGQDNSNGTLLISAGAALSSHGGNIALFGTSTKATVTVDGPGSNWAITGSLNVAQSSDGTLSTGTLAIVNGARVVCDALYAGQYSGTGSIAVRTGSRLDISSNALIGNALGSVAGKASLTVADGATLNLGGNLRMFNGSSLAVSGGVVSANTIDLAGAGSMSFTGGTISVNGGTFKPRLGTITYDPYGQQSQSFELAGDSGAAPTLKLLGGATCSTNTNYFIVGNRAAGNLIVQGNGSALSQPGALVVGTGASGAGSVVISDGASVTASNGLYIGDAEGVGTVVVQGADAKLLTSPASAFTRIGFDGTSSGALSIRQGAQYIGSGLFVGDGSVGQLTVDGLGSRVNTGTGSASFLNVGAIGNWTGLPDDPGEGTVVISTGGRVDTSVVHLGIRGSVGRVFLSGPGAQLNAGQLYVGFEGDWLPAVPLRSTGSLTVSDGASAITTSASYVGRMGGIGTMSLSNATASGGVYYIGFYLLPNTSLRGEGMLQVVNGSTFAPRGIELGNESGTGSMLVRDMQTRVTTIDGIAIARPATINTAIASQGTLSVAAGASINVGKALTVFRSGLVTLDGGTLTAATISLQGGQVLLGAGNAAKLVAGVVETTNDSLLDLNDDDMRLTASSYDQVLPQLIAGRAGGSWTGTRIASSAARRRPGTTLGVLNGSEYLTVSASTFDGDVVAASDVLIKYTYYGDTDLNGVVNFDDYARIDSGFNNNRSGWVNGDFDYNGVVNFDDYAFIDLAFNTQGSPLNGLRAVPEPGACVSGLGIVIFSLARRRRVV
jgi:T5SS/PEP-CTERM-associated repeat protein